ncbi:MAG TPA: hypothetical protein VHS31_13185 [Tepidisphaeraceae bacterium]|jgi:hypothetical protein|nr:hypothetical protein [Tepidisphaeraceae bacterium]
MRFLDRLFNKKPTPVAAAGAPFMEHPTGQFKSAVDAMADAIKRLRALPEWKDWITFCAQGVGEDEDSDFMAEIRMRRDELQLDEPVDVDAIIQHAGVARASLVKAGENYSVAGASPAEAAWVMDAIFRLCLGIRPHADEKDDYAVGAEW